MSPLLALEDVSLSRWRGRHETVVLADVSLELHAGEVLAVWGQRGAGKTTLALVAAGLERPQSGTVRFESRDLAGRGRGLHEGVAWLLRGGPASEGFQSVLDYVSLPLLAGRHSPRNARRLAEAMLARLEIGACASARWSNLTDRERSLVALAHALVREPRLLVADDATVGLDVLQREEIAVLLRRAADEDGVGVLLTAPDMPATAHADRIGSLSGGRLALAGLPTGRGANVIEFPSTRHLA